METKDRLCGPVMVAFLALASGIVASVRSDLLGMQERLGILAAQDSLAARGELPGQGVRIAVIDDGFCLRHRSLARLQDSGLADSWDFARAGGPAWDTLARLSHGSATLGLLASAWDTLPGIVPAATFLLYRTEVDSFERLSEEAWLAQAIGRAVDSGATVVSISLGYRYAFDSVGDLPWRSFDGKTRPESVAAAAAARDAVVVVAMGNDGAGEVPTLGAPADAEGILAVGAVDSLLARCSFSSNGKTYDGRMKPDLAAFGCPVPVVDAADTDGVIDYRGTSFATPIVAGMAALLRQIHPSWSASEVVAALKASGSQASSPDSLLGWGVPDLRRCGITGLGAEVLVLPASAFRLDGGGVLVCLADLGAGRLELWDVSGRKRASWAAMLTRGSRFQLPDAARGLLLLRWQGRAGTRTLRLVRP